jgi:hypothetical protein
LTLKSTLLQQEIGLLKWELPGIMGPSVDIGSRTYEEDETVPSTSSREEYTPQKWWQKILTRKFWRREFKKFLKNVYVGRHHYLFNFIIGLILGTISSLFAVIFRVFVFVL